MKPFHWIVVSILILASWAAPHLDSVSATYTFGLRNDANPECAERIVADAMRAEGYSVNVDRPGLVLGRQPARGMMAYILQTFGQNVELRMISEIKPDILQVNLGHMTGKQIEAIPPPRLTGPMGAAVDKINQECI